MLETVKKISEEEHEEFMDPDSPEDMEVDGEELVFKSLPIRERNGRECNPRINTVFRKSLQIPLSGITKPKAFSPRSPNSAREFKSYSPRTSGTAFLSPRKTQSARETLLVEHSQEYANLEVHRVRLI